MIRGVLSVCQGQYTFIMSNVLPFLRAEVNGAFICEPPPIGYVWDARQKFLNRVVLSVCELGKDVDDRVIHLH